MRPDRLREFAFINMADELTDEELRKQLIAYGAKTVGPITATTRPIYVKKLNHLKVNAKKSSVPAVKNNRGRKVLAFSSDESEDETIAEPANRSRSSVGRSSRGRQNESTVASTRRSTDTKTKPDDSFSSLGFLGRRPLRSTTNTNYDDRQSKSFSMQASFTSPGADTSSSRLTDRGRGSRLSENAFRPSSSRYSDDLELSDSDADHENEDGRDHLDHGTDLSYSYDSPEKVSVSVNTSPRLDDSSLFNRTLSRLSGVGSMWSSSRRQSYGRSNDSLNPKYERQSRPKSPVTVNENASINHQPANHSLGSRFSLGQSGGSTSLSNRTSLGTRSVPSTSQQNRVSSNMNNPRRRSGGQQLQHSSRMSTTTSNSPPNHISHNNDKLYEEENILQHGFKTKEDPSSYKISQNISMVLLSVVILFFVCLAGVYIGMNSPRAEVAEIPSKDNWMVCAVSAGDVGSVWCYPMAKVHNARLIILEMADILSERAGGHECGVPVSPNMTRVELVNHLKKRFKPGEFGEDGNAKYDFSIALNLTLHNPHWRISLYDISGGEARDPAHVHALESQVPYRGTLCRLRVAALSIVYYIAGLLSIAMVIFLVVTFMRYRWRKQEEETKQVYELVERVIDMLMAHHDTHRDKPYLAIPHVRDMIIDPKQRRSMQHLWDKAVKFLSANESRIRVETQKIAGEEFAVWRWLPTNTNGKVWQGSAFGESESNYSQYPPTECLKIRNMFDPTVECEEDWHVNIQDAILEKVMHANGSHGIVHIAVEKSSPEGCVYIKCLSPEEAGKAHKALHGWWFDNSLVTARYLRLHRYHERFPGAIRFTSPLSPSNNQRRSLAQPFHRSIIESC